MSGLDVEAATEWRARTSVSRRARAYSRGNRFTASGLAKVLDLLAQPRPLLHGHDGGLNKTGTCWRQHAGCTPPTPQNTAACAS